jgi:hypothetical protein
MSGALTRLYEATRDYEAAMPAPRSRKATVAWDKLRTVMREVMTEALAPIPDEMRCDFCGMERGVSRVRGLPDCAPPFDVRPHQWTGKHPSHVGKPISKAIARHAEAMAEEIWDRWNVDARVQWRKLSGDKRDRILSAEGVETGNVRLTTYVDESLMERSRRYSGALS